MTRMTPFDFQQEAIDKLWPQKSCLVGDDMGLGKTLVGIELDRKRRAEAIKGGEETARRKTLIVAPLSVINSGSWQEHIQRQCGDVPIYVINPKKRAEFEKVAGDGRKPGYFIIHWEGLRLCKSLGRVDWFHVIADEVHRAKSRKAQQTQALKAIRTEYKTGLSGTPADNKPDDLWSIVNWLWPSYYRSYWNFCKHYCLMERVDGDDASYIKVTGVQNAESLHKEMDPWFVRRLKEDVLKELPDKYETAVWVDLAPAQRRAYNEMRDELIAWLGEQDKEIPLVAPVVVAQLQRLQMFALASAEITGYREKDYVDKDGEKQTRTVPIVRMIDPSAKLDAAMEIIQDSTGPVVVFSQFKGAIRLLEERCRKAKVSIATLTGDTKQQDRTEAIQGFQAGRYHVFAGTIAAGGVGITLTRASTVVFLDRAWSPSMNRQAEDRLHRIGQKNAVQVIDIMARSTVDLGRRQRIEQKWSWLQELLGDK